MASKSVHLPVLQSGLGRTLRQDAWWVGPAITFLILSSFIVYATFRAFENAHYDRRPVPLAVLLAAHRHELREGLADSGLAARCSSSPGPRSFRFTCYYYRKAYYRAFAMDPPACAVGESARHKYNGERKLLIFQNLHRFTLYVAIAVPRSSSGTTPSRRSSVGKTAFTSTSARSFSR